MDYFFLGEEELVTAFRFIGIDGMAVNDEDEAIAMFRQITEEKSDYKVLILTEETAGCLGDYMVNWQISGHYPLLVEIPGINGKHINKKTLVEQIREAIGIHV